LIKDCNYSAFLGADDTTSSTYINVGALMVINAKDINSSSSFKDHSDISTGNTTLAPL
jgi:hypothetical protein